MALTSSSAQAQAGGVETVVVRALEESRQATILIARDEQAEPERIEFAWNERTGSKMSASKGYYAVFSKLFAQGYQLQATIPGVLNSTGNGYTYSTLLFTRPSAK